MTICFGGFCNLHLEEIWWDELYLRVTLCKTSFIDASKARSSWVAAEHQLDSCCSCCRHSCFDMCSECVSVHAPLVKCQANDSSWILKNQPSPYLLPVNITTVFQRVQLVLCLSRTRERVWSGLRSNHSNMKRRTVVLWCGERRTPQREREREWGRREVLSVGGKMRVGWNDPNHSAKSYPPGDSWMEIQRLSARSQTPNCWPLVNIGLSTSGEKTFSTR